MQTPLMKLNIDDPVGVEESEPDRSPLFPSSWSDSLQPDDSRRDDLLAWMSRTHNSIRATAALMGQRGSEKKLEAWVKNPSIGLSQDLVAAIDRLLDDRSHLAGGLRDVVFCQISIAGDLWELFQFCEGEKQMGAAFCPAGTGKTVVAEQFKRQHPDTILLTANIKKRSAGAILGEFSEVLGLPCYGAFDVSMRRIAEVFLDYTPLVIIDESHQLRFDAFESLRGIYDMVEFPLVYLGQERLLDEMRSRTKRKLWDQIASRLTVRRRLGNTIARSDVDLIARSFCKKLDAQSLAFLHRVSQGEGRFRSMVNLLKLALRMGKGRVDVGVLRQAKKFLMI